MPTEISHVQLAMLQGAVAREDRLLQPPGKARGAVARTLAGKLIDAGWAKEVAAPSGAPVWRKDTTSGIALKLTAKGVKAAAAAGEKVRGGKAPPSVAAAGKKETTAPAPRPAAAPTAPLNATARDPADGASTPAQRAPRAGSKLGDVVTKLSAESGATIGELTTATGWLEHTTRAALTGLRHRGFALSLTRRERHGASVYRIASTDCEARK